MVNELAILSVALAYAALFAWAFRVLPQEHWQFLAAVPRHKGPDGQWVGVNLTYYGVFSAAGVAVAVAIVVTLMGALAVPMAVIAMLSIILLGCCVPAAKLVARTIEAQANTFTIGGAAFVGILIAPWALLLTDYAATRILGSGIPMVPLLAVMAIAYAFGEGTGRLACISFGCCYGKPLSVASPRLIKLFRTHHFIFSGATKKAAYESGLEAVPVIPIQAVTALVFVTTGLVGAVLFFQGRMLAAFLVTWVLTQVWRVVSEFFRADYRGGAQRLSIYQILAAAGACYGVGTALLLSHPVTARPDLLAGLHALWNPVSILAIQAVWLVIFLYTGRSKVTASTLAFSLSHPRR